MLSNKITFPFLRGYQGGKKQVVLVSDTKRKCMELRIHRSSIALQALNNSHLFTLSVNDDILIPKALSKFPYLSPITFTIKKLEKDRAVSLPGGPDSC